MEGRDKIYEQAAAEWKPPRNLTMAKAQEDLAEAGYEIDSKMPAAVWKELWAKEFRAEKSAALADQLWRGQALNPNEGRIICVGLKAPDGEVTTTHWGDDEKWLLSKTFDDIRRMAGMGTVPRFIGHNVRFDLEFLWKRAVILEEHPLCDIPWDGRHDKDYYCTMQAWAGFGKRISLRNLAAILGLPEPETSPGSEVLDHYLDGDMELIGDHCAEDIKLTEAIWRRLNWK